MITAIREYFSNPITKQVIDDTEMTFELCLDNDDDSNWGKTTLSLSVIGDEGLTQYDLKKFNNESKPHQFVRKLFREYPDGGDIELDLSESESMSKFIERIGLIGKLKTVFFGRSSVNTVNFKGLKIKLLKSEIKHLNLILEQLKAS